MATIREILSSKGSQVWTIGPEASVQEAVHIMNEHHIGALVVCDARGIVGIFTERDVLRRVVGEGRDPGHTPVGEVMSHDVVCAALQTSIEEARAAMMNHRLRHLPVVNDDQILGLVSITDLNAFQVASQETTIHHLHEYLYGRV